MSALWLPGQPLVEEEPLRDEDGLPIIVTAPHDHPATDLPWTDRLRLRRAAAAALRQAGLPEAMNTAAEQDKYIDSLLRSTAEKMIKAVVDADAGRR